MPFLSKLLNLFMEILYQAQIINASPGFLYINLPVGDI